MLRTIIVGIICLTLGALFGIGIGHLVQNSEQLSSFWPAKPEQPWVLLPGMLSVCFTVIAIHELGHLLMGLWQGFDFQLFVVGFLGIRREEDRSIKVYFNRDWNFFGGVAATAPTEYTPKTLEQLARVMLAGPMASLGLALLALCLAVLTGGVMRMLFFITGLMSLLIVLATTLPEKTGLFYTDRKRYQRLKNGGQAQAIEGALAQANAQKLREQPMTDLPLAQLRKITEDELALVQYLGYFYLYEYHLMTREWNELELVKVKMESLAQKLPKSLIKHFDRELEKLETDTKANV
ncbi:MAG: site-2 protease family protein [Bacteroidota bacterium]